MSFSTNAAYGTAKFGSDVNIQQPISQPTIQSETGDGTHTYEMITVNVPLHLDCMIMLTSNTLHVICLCLSSL